MNEQRPWLTIYPKGVPANIDQDAYGSVAELIDECCRNYKKLPVFSCMGKTINFQQLDKLSTQFAAYLHSRGMQPGQKIAIMMPNLLQYPIALTGCLKAGLTIVNINPLYTPREMHHQFTDSNVSAVLIAENFGANLEKILGQTEIRTIIVTSIGEMLGPVKGRIVNFVVRKIKRLVPSFNLPNVVSFRQALRQGKKFKIEPFDNEPDRVVLHQYTGGTTGVSKGAMLTNRNLVTNMLQIRAIMATRLKEKEEVALCPLPLYHIFAFTVNCLAMMSFGAHSILIVNPRKLDTIVKEFRRHPVSLVTGVNTLFNALSHHKSFSKLDFSSLKVCVAGGMALQNAVAEYWHQVTGCPIAQGYGLTECAPVASVNPIDGSGRLGTIGMPVPSTDMAVMDEDGKMLPAGEVGEIRIRGPQVMKGYYNRPQESRQVLVDGWLRTGDVGKMHPDGYFEVIDRQKDMINVSGFNVYPNEIEEVVTAHEKVLESAAIGIPHPKSGEAVKLFVVKKDKGLTKDELIAYCRENMTAYKIPREIEFRDSLPKSNVGKILRRLLREETGEDDTQPEGSGD